MSAEALNDLQLKNYAETNDRRMERLQEMMRVIIQAQYCSQLPPDISMSFIYVLDATGRKHPLTINMAGSLEVCFCIYSDIRNSHYAY